MLFRKRSLSFVEDWIKVIEADDKVSEDVWQVGGSKDSGGERVFAGEGTAAHGSPRPPCLHQHPHNTQQHSTCPPNTT